MTAYSLETPAGSHSGPDSTPGPDRWAFLFGVIMVLIYSQAAVAPLSGETGDPEASALLRSLYYPAYAGALFILATSWRRTVLALIKAPLLIAMVGFAALSVLWSVAPEVTVRRSVALIFTCLGGVVLAARFSWPRLAELLATAFAVLALASLAVGVFLPSVGRMSDLFPGSWRGLWFEKNALGQYMTIGFSVCTAAALLNPHRQKLWSAFAALCVLLVLLSTSKTSLASLLLSVSVFGFIWLVRRGPAAGVIALWFGVIVVGGVASFLILEPDKAFALFGKDATLTGRTRIWSAATRQIHANPTFGYGYGAVWDDKDLWAPLAKISKEAGFVARHAHSSWIEQSLGLGLVGFTLWALWFGETMIRALISIFTRKNAYLAAPYLAAYALSTLTESVTLIWNELIWVMFVTIAVKLALGERAPQFAATMRARA